MTDDQEMTATPHAELIAELMNPNNPKNEREHAAVQMIERLQEALAQPEQEPVKMVAYNCTCGRTMKFESVHGVVAPQRTWVGLTEDEIETIYAECNVWDKFEYERMIEAKLKEKNT